MRRSLRERAVARNEARDPNDHEPMWRMACELKRGSTPLEAYFIAGLGPDRKPGPLRPDEQEDAERKIEGILKDPVFQAFQRQLDQPAHRTLDIGAQIAAATQIRKGMGARAERSAILANQDLMNRGGLPATTVQKIENLSKDLEGRSLEDLEGVLQGLIEEVRQQRGAAH